MNFDGIPIVGFFAATTILVVLAIEVGYRLGCIAHRRTEDEKESPVSAMTGATMGLLAFILAFTFAIVADRYDSRRALVREDANAIRTAFLRSDFLPESDRDKTAGLLAEYVELRLVAGQTGAPEQVRKAVVESAGIHRQLWEMAVANARVDMNSDVAALYIESLNELINFHALRVTVALATRLSNAIWLVLYALLVLTMAGFGYQTGIAGSRRSWASPLLALSFAVVIALIAALDRPESGYFTASQQPLAVLRDEMSSAFESRQRSQDIPRRD